MAEFRYTSINPENNAVQGIVSAKNRKSATAAIDNICSLNHLKLVTIEKKSTYLYVTQRLNESPQKGEQRAFSKEEITNALQKMGYKVVRIQRKLFDFRITPPSKDIVMFIRITADLLREKLVFNEILPLLLSDMVNRALKETIREINQDLKEGKEGKEAFGKHRDILGKFPAEAFEFVNAYPGIGWEIKSPPRPQVPRNTCAYAGLNQEPHSPKAAFATVN